jgi:hypothetical protein
LVAQRGKAELLNVRFWPLPDRSPADALATVEQFNARLWAKKSAWFWPTIAAALTSKHHWLIIACDSCGTVIDLDLHEATRPGSLCSRCASRRAMPAL